MPGVVWLALMNATTRRSVRRSTAALKASSLCAWERDPPVDDFARAACGDQCLRGRGQDVLEDADNDVVVDVWAAVVRSCP
jgi:hypothetical protein